MTPEVGSTGPRPSTRSTWPRRGPRLSTRWCSVPSLNLSWKRISTLKIQEANQCEFVRLSLHFLIESKNNIVIIKGPDHFPYEFLLQNRQAEKKIQWFTSLEKGQQSIDWSTKFWVKWVCNYCVQCFICSQSVETNKENKVISKSYCLFSLLTVL